MCFCGEISATTQTDQSYLKKRKQTVYTENKVFQISSQK